MLYVVRIKASARDVSSLNGSALTDLTHRHHHRRRRRRRRRNTFTKTLIIIVIKAEYN